MAGARRVGLLRVQRLSVGSTAIDGEGVVIRDGDGHDRATLTVGGDGAELVLTGRGADALALSAYGPNGRPFYPGASIALCDGEGNPAAAWHVEPGGAVNRLVGDERTRSRTWRSRSGSSLTVARTRRQARPRREGRQ